MGNIRKRYGNFICRNSGSPYDARNVRIRLKSGGDPVNNIKISKKDKGWLVSGRGMRLKLEKQCYRGTIFADINIFDSVLRILYSLILPEEEGLLIHASG
ncbi:MAG: hypothetical protein PF545_05255, partial [Elusimicrobia bacterium]|nr:hypothetical protein [Elusimicrobiota bacterium]